MSGVEHDVPFFTAILQHALTQAVTIAHVVPVAGGDIHQSYRVMLADDRCYFIKCNDGRYFDLLVQEHDALAVLSKSGAVRVPAVYGVGEYGGVAYLVLEWLALCSQGDEVAMGQALALLHRHRNDRFGWGTDNFIGFSVQKNTWNCCWVDFWREQRLLPQILHAVNSGVGQELARNVDQFIAASDTLLKHHNPEPSLVHGDLWAGNKAYLPEGTPVIFDPASYYGDAETDIAFTRLFGGFGSDFYTAYYSINDDLGDEASAVSHVLNLESLKQRQVLYNSYHQLNHLNLWGESYLAGCKSAMQSVIDYVS